MVRNGKLTKGKLKSTSFVVKPSHKLPTVNVKITNPSIITKTCLFKYTKNFTTKK